MSVPPEASGGSRIVMRRTLPAWAGRSDRCPALRSVADEQSHAGEHHPEPDRAADEHGAEKDREVHPQRAGEHGDHRERREAAHRRDEGDRAGEHGATDDPLVPAGVGQLPLLGLHLLADPADLQRVDPCEVPEDLADGLTCGTDRGELPRREVVGLDGDGSEVGLDVEDRDQCGCDGEQEGPDDQLHAVVPRSARGSGAVPGMGSPIRATRISDAILNSSKALAMIAPTQESRVTRRKTANRAELTALAGWVQFSWYTVRSTT